ncbi:hypothetical protein PPYR_15766, partial [Photinus pyralis]
DIKKNKYYSVSVDSSPDISHVDQLAFVIRTVTKDGNPVERFLGFKNNVGHKAEQLINSLLNALRTWDIDIKDCRGQSFDNASNMS